MGVLLPELAMTNPGTWVSSSTETLPHGVVEPILSVPNCEAVAKRFVLEAVVEKKLVVVAEVPVAFTKVKFCRVLEPVRRRLESVVKPPVAVRVPVKLAAAEIVWPLIKPEVIGPRVAVPVVREVEKRLVDEAVVAKKLVEVAAVVVERVIKISEVEAVVPIDKTSLAWSLKRLTFALSAKFLATIHSSLAILIEATVLVPVRSRK